MVASARTTAMGLGAPRLRRRLDQQLHELPVLSEVAVELTRLRPESPRHFEEVRRLVELEPAFSTRLLAAANSAASAPRQPILGVSAALQRIGSRAAANLLLASAVTNTFAPRDDWERALWRHALEVAVLARALAPSEGADPEHAYTCGLLHDVGRFLLLRDAPERLREIEETVWSTPEEQVAAERAVCGLTHADLGALACRKWRIPETIAQVVADHHAPQRSRGPLAKVVMLADALMGQSAEDTAAREPIQPDLVVTGAANAAAAARARVEATAMLLALGFD
jgi:putative nucleotidyltransferase with HDIG domain